MDFGILDILCILLVLAGLVFFLGASIGLLRFPDFYTRMHAAGKGDTLSTLLIIGGVCVYELNHMAAGDSTALVTFQIITKILAVGMLIMLTSPTSTHALMQAGYETLIEAGYAPEMAYFECIHEVKLIVDLIYEGGVANMRYSVSNTAEYGDFTRGPRVVDAGVKERMKQVLSEIQEGQFAREFILENQSGEVSFNAMRRRAAEHPMEEVGAHLRGLMPWLQEKRLVDRSKN